MTPKTLSRPEFIALMAMLFATIAFSVDSMLPALPEIADELTPANPNRAQLIITSFVLGMGLGTLFTGPLSDAFGRKPVIVWGSVLYCGAAVLAWAAPTLEMILAARVLQGLGAAAPRIVALAIVRDLYEGRRMAQLMSFVMLVFSLVPAVAPLLGQVVIDAFGWRSIFISFVLFNIIALIWLTIRQPETLARDHRRPFRLATLGKGIAEVLSHRVVVISILVQSLGFGMLFSVLSSTQPIFDETFGRADSFPLWFALIAVVAALASVLNARIVMRLGMRRVAAWTFAIQAIVSSVMVSLSYFEVLSPGLSFAAFVIWNIGIFGLAGLTIGNLQALAMEPLGHLAGTAASVLGAFATVLAVIIAVPVGLAFDGTPIPLILSASVLSALAFALTFALGEPNPIGDEV